MIVRELIEVLQTFGPDTRVVISGYEGGIEDVDTVHAMTVRLWVHGQSGSPSGVYGPHEDAAKSDDQQSSAVVAGVYLGARGKYDNAV